MSLKLNNEFVRGFVADTDVEAIRPEIENALETVKNKDGAGNDFLGWYDLPVNYDREEYDRIKAAAQRIKNMCDVLIVIGIGGSYLGARAAIEYIQGNLYNNVAKDTPDIYFAGNSISTSALNDLLKICEGKDVCVNVISKSGTTTEPAVVFRVFRELLVKKYGEEEAKKRIFATTDKARGKLKELSDKIGYETFVVPDDVGGRFSVLTAVGLLPIAVAGVDLDQLMKGAQDARAEYTTKAFEDNECLKYAAYRNVLERSGKTTEILVAYEPSAQMLCEWWKQLYGESEGKDNKGLFPASVIFSTDLHSLGQYIQDGQRNIFETVLDIQGSNDTICVPFDEANSDGLNFLAGKEIHEINRTAMKATLYAHMDGGVPNIVVEVPDRSAYSFGYMVYFFELACAVSGYTLGVNPFNQPGVEEYKKNMFALLDKPDPSLDALKAELKARMAK
ncbi:MAG: glucose-6-phosphate isomerase [Clostridia bacterium]|nr:glucose-6-phosphate isomerase [Clostridia bacterium]